MAKSKDLFDDTTMTFGEHLEILRIHLWRSIIGLGICVIGSLYFGNHVIDMVRAPIDAALRRHNVLEEKVKVEDDVRKIDLLQHLRNLVFGDDDKDQQPPPEPEGGAHSDTITVTIDAQNLAKALNQADPRFDVDPREGVREAVSLRLTAPEFREFRKTGEQVRKPVTLNVQEAFLTYLKVSFVAGFVIASPWVFYQLWLFVAAGLYQHERRYVYFFLPLSLGLFLAGAAFCFFLVFPFVLDFLLHFNLRMGVTPQIRLSEWITFAITLPLMFGLSFQLPLVMLFLERIGVFEAESYRSSRRMAILVIAVISMLMTPADPMSMLLMMFPLLGLYELGILMCHMQPSRRTPFETE